MRAVTGAINASIIRARFRSRPAAAAVIARYRSGTRAAGGAVRVLAAVGSLPLDILLGAVTRSRRGVHRVPLSAAELAVGLTAVGAAYIPAAVRARAAAAGRFGVIVRERTQAGLIAARSRGHKGGRKPKMTNDLIGKAQRIYDARQFAMAEIATSCGVTPDNHLDDHRLA